MSVSWTCWRSTQLNVLVLEAPSEQGGPRPDSHDMASKWWQDEDIPDKAAPEEALGEEEECFCFFSESSGELWQGSLG